MRKSPNQILSCSLCMFTARQERRLVKHLKEIHKKTEELSKIYVETVLGGIVPKCACTACGEVPTFNGWARGFNKFIIGHSGNITLFCAPQEAERIREQRRKTFRQRNHNSWRKGLTKETSESIKRGSEKISKTRKERFSSGQIISHTKGLTKETSASVRKQSETAKRQFSSGERTAWHKGRTKESDPRVAKMAESLSTAMLSHPRRKELDDNKRLPENIILERLAKHAPDLELISNIQQYTRDIYNNLSFRCRKCGDTRQRSLVSALTNRCHACDPIGSNPQIEISNFIRNMQVGTVLNNRSLIGPKQVDIWIPSRNFAIEYNGLFYHNVFQKEDPNYHAAKTHALQGQGIQLLHIFQDEWRDKQEIVKSMISHRVGKTSRVLFARNLKVVNLDQRARKMFFNDTHVDGDVGAKVAFALVDAEGDVVTCLSLRKPRQKKYKGQIELARLATARDTRVTGGLSRLLKHATAWAKKEGYTGIMTYVDTRHGNGNSYRKVGFDLVGRTPNRFWWTDDVYRYDRFKFRANRAAGLSEKQVAEQAGVKKIWGCPNLIMQLSF